MSFKKMIRLKVYSKLKRVTSAFERAAYFRGTTEPKLNVGAGKNILSGWLNVDLYPHFGAVRMDAGKPWPFPDQTFAAVVCEHMIEHVPKDLANWIVQESWRVLRDDGVIRIVTPDLSFFSKMADNPTAPECQEYLRGIEDVTGMAMSPCDAVNEIFYGHGHRYIYTVSALAEMLEAAGFKHLEIARGGQAIHSMFQGVDGHGRVIGARMNEIEAFAIEARRS